MVYLKLFLFLIFAVSLFWTDSMWYCTLVLSASALVYLFYPDKRMKRGLIPIGILAMGVFISNLLMFNPGKVVYSFMGITITDSSTELALIRATRVIGLVYGAKVLTLSLGIEEIVSALKRFFSPLKRLGIDADGFFDTVMLTVNMLPAVKEEAIERVQRRSQTDEAGKGLVGRIRIWIDVIVHLMVETIRMPETLLKKTGHTEG